MYNKLQRQEKSCALVHSDTSEEHQPRNGVDVILS